MAPPGQPKHMLDRAKLVPNPTSLIAYLETSNVQREPLTPSLASHKSRALLAFENRHADRSRLCVYYSCGYVTATAIIMEHSSALFDIDNSENSVVRPAGSC